MSLITGTLCCVWALLKSPGRPVLIHAQEARVSLSLQRHQWKRSLRSVHYNEQRNSPTKRWKASHMEGWVERVTQSMDFIKECVLGRGIPFQQRSVSWASKSWHALLQTHPVCSLRCQTALMNLVFTDRFIRLFLNRISQGSHCGVQEDHTCLDKHLATPTGRPRWTPECWGMAGAPLSSMQPGCCSTVFSPHSLTLGSPE